MSVLFADIIAGAKSLADFDGAGAGASLSLDDARWSIWGNQSIESLYKKFLIWNPDLFESTASPDYVLALEEGQITPPADYRSFKGLTKSPDTFAQRTVRKFNYGQRDDQCDVHYREAGKVIRLEPKHRSNGTYRLTYTAGPVNLSTGDAPLSQQAPNVTVKAMGGSEVGLTYINNSVQVALYLPITDRVVRLAGGLTGSWIPAGIGPGSTITNTINGTSQLDATTMAGSDNVLIFVTGGNATPNNFGMYVVTQAGSGSLPTILTRSAGYDDPSEVTFGSSFYVSAGATNATKRIVMDTPGTISVGVTQLSFDIAGTAQLLIDGANVNPGDKVFILTGQASYDGVWDVSVTIGAKGSQWWLTRSTGETAGTVHSVGYTIGVQQGTANGNRIWTAAGNLAWAIQSTTWSKLPAAIDPLYEPGREWLEVRTAMRALGKEESNTGELGARLAELTAELQVYLQSLDSGDGDTAVDVEDHRPGLYRLLGH